MKNFISQFENDGFCVIPNAIDLDLVDKVNNDTDLFLKANLKRLT